MPKSTQKALFGALGERCPKTLKKHSGGTFRPGPLSTPVNGAGIAKRIQRSPRHWKTKENPTIFRKAFDTLSFLRHVIRYRPKGVFGKGVGNASEMRQKCVKMGLVLLGKEERQKAVKIASKMRGKPWGRREHLLDDTEL